MQTVGVSEARAKLPELLERVEAGERILLTRKGRNIAYLCPLEWGDRPLEADASIVRPSASEIVPQASIPAAGLTFQDISRAALPD